MNISTPVTTFFNSPNISVLLPAAIIVPQGQTYQGSSSTKVSIACPCFPSLLSLLGARCTLVGIQMPTSANSQEWLYYWSIPMLVHISSLLQCTCIVTHLTHENTFIYLDTICQLGMSEHDMQSDCNQIRPVSNVANWLCSIKFISCLQYNLHVCILQGCDLSGALKSHVYLFIVLCLFSNFIVQVSNHDLPPTID